MTELPPSRYRVIERDRRLVVIDTRPGATPPPSPGGRAGAAGWLPRRVRFDGAAELTTRAFYDAKGPRTVLLDPAAAQWLGVARIAVVPALLAFGVLMWMVPVVLILAAVPFHPKMRERARALITRRLDGPTPR